MPDFLSLILLDLSDGALGRETYMSFQQVSDPGKHRPILDFLPGVSRRSVDTNYARVHFSFCMLFND